MLPSLYAFTRPLLFSLAPEDAHEATLSALERGVYPRAASAMEPALRTKVFGLDFPNPLGIAAGFDKDARVPDAVLGMGCGFAEIGTVTPKPQSGNAKPRVFRLLEDEGLVNRLGFNNGGHRSALARLSQRSGRGIVGVNIGANKDTNDRAADYVAGLQTFNAVASYFTVNISSPNTPGLRDLQAPAALDELLGRVMAARAELVAAGAPQRPVIVKIAPDIANEDIDPIVERLLTHKVDGIAVSNTTLARPNLQSEYREETGGLSGRPMFERATIMLARVYRATGGNIPLIGIGGIDSGDAAVAKVRAGASLLQLYTGLIYKGPCLISEITSALAREVRREQATSIAELVGRDVALWAERPLIA